MGMLRTCRRCILVRRRQSGAPACLACRNAPLHAVPHRPQGRCCRRDGPLHTPRYDAHCTRMPRAWLAQPCGQPVPLLSASLWCRWSLRHWLGLTPSWLRNQREKRCGRGEAQQLGHFCQRALVVRHELPGEVDAGLVQECGECLPRPPFSRGCGRHPRMPATSPARQPRSAR